MVTHWRFRRGDTWRCRRLEDGRQWTGNEGVTSGPPTPSPPFQTKYLFNNGETSSLVSPRFKGTGDGRELGRSGSIYLSNYLSSTAGLEIDSELEQKESKTDNQLDRYRSYSVRRSSYPAFKSLTPWQDQRFDNFGPEYRPYLTNFVGSALFLLQFTISRTLRGPRLIASLETAIYIEGNYFGCKFMNCRKPFSRIQG